MFTINRFALRRNKEGDLFLDAELTLMYTVQTTFIRLSVPTSPGFQPEPGQPIVEGDLSIFNQNRTE